ncbi:hypothetical protein CWI37_1746p0010, partial [Hamiltosporidium tvaerminnensis]
MLKPIDLLILLNEMKIPGFYFFEELRSFDKEKKPIFHYNKDNFIKFNTLDNILMANSTISDSVIGIIMCSYELSYYLKLTKDITELP